MRQLAKSPLRYPGGKSRAIESILAHVPSKIGEYREPFLGGGSVFFAIKSLFGKHISRYWVNDIYPDLAYFWQAVRDNPEALLAHIATLKATYPNGRKLYEHLRSDDEKTPFELAVRFFIMNRITFSGVMDAGGYSEKSFEGRFTPSSLERVRTIAPLLQGVTITQEDYESLLLTTGENVFIFLDPPYFSATGSRLYGKKGQLHTQFDHERFAHLLKSCPHKWLVTYDDSPYIRELFSFAHLTTWELQYGMNNYKQSHAEKGHELFLSNF